MEAHEKKKFERKEVRLPPSSLEQKFEGYFDQRGNVYDFLLKTGTLSN